MNDEHNWDIYGSVSNFFHFYERSPSIIFICKDCGQIELVLAIDHWSNVSFKHLQEFFNYCHSYGYNYSIWPKI